MPGEATKQVGVARHEKRPPKAQEQNDAHPKYLRRDAFFSRQACEKGRRSTQAPGSNWRLAGPGEEIVANETG